MKIKKSLLSVCLSISLMFGSFVPSITVYASSGETDDSNFVDRFNDKFYEITKSVSGIIFSPIAGVKDSFKSWLSEHKENYGGSSSETADDFIGRNFSYDSSNYNIGQNLINSMRDFNQYYISNDSNVRYGYTYGSTQWADRFENPALYNSFLNILEEYDGSLILAYSNQYNWPSTIFVYDSNVKLILDRLYNNNIAVYIYSDYQTHASTSDVLIAFNASGSQYVETTTYPDYYTGSLKFNPEDPIVSLNIGQRFVSLDSSPFPIYDTSSYAFGNSNGTEQYYISDSYNTSHVDNSMVLSISEVDNSVTYNDVNNYIDTFRDTNNRLPTSTEIYIYINTYEPNNPTPTPTPTPTPEPGGDDDDNKNIWDFLSELGDIIGNLIAGLGEILAGILSAITSIINTFKEGFPNVIGSLLEYFLPFLPEEIITLISLSILFSIILGIVKIIRG